MDRAVVRRLAERHSTLLILLALLVAVWLVTAAFGGRPTIRTITELFIQVTLVVGMSSFIGNSGVISFGHVGFMAVGAYVTAWTTVPPLMKGMVTPWLPSWLAALELPLPLAALAAGLAAAVVALLTGAVLMRLAGIAAAIGTFAFLLIMNVLISNAEGLTGGTSSLAGIPVNVTMPLALLGACFAVVVAHFYRTSRSGLALQASRDDEVAARAYGVNIFRHRLVAYAVSAFICGVAGALYAQYMGVISAAAFYTETTFIALAMLICGGMFSLSGAVTGVLVLTLIRHMLGALEKGYQFGDVSLKLPAGAEATLIGVAMIVILVRRPSGLTNNIEFRIPFSTPHPKQAGPGATWRRVAAAMGIGNTTTRIGG